MPTHGGPGPSAELLEALRACCPDVADEAFEAVVAMLEAVGDTVVGDGEGGAGDEDGLRWRSLTLGDIPGLAELLSILAAPVRVIAALLEIIAGILDILAALLLDILDPFRALILAAYELLKRIIEDFLASGAYLYVDLVGLDDPVLTRPPVEPGSDDAPWVPGGPPMKIPPRQNGFDAWAGRFRASFDDPGDTARPVFSDRAPVEALFVVGTAPDIPDMGSILALLEKLFDAKSFTKAWDAFAETFPVIPPDPTRTRARTTPRAPDWKSWKLADIAPPDYPLRKLLWVPWLLKTLLLNTDSIIGLLRNLAKAIREKAAMLRQLVDILQGLIDALMALTATGLHYLVVVTDEGVEGLTEAFRTAKDRPNTDEDGKGRGADVVAGVCLLAGTTELAPVNALPIWALFGQQRSFEQAYAGLVEDAVAFAGQAEDAFADTIAMAQGTWSGLPGASPDSPEGQGVRGLGKDLVAELTDVAGDQLDAVLALLGITAEELAAWGRENPGWVADAVEQAIAAGGGSDAGAGTGGGAASGGAPSGSWTSLPAGNVARAAGPRDVLLDPRVLAHLEAHRRAGSRGSRSLAAALGLRDAGGRG